jgi:lipoprotein-anchoring transpeptidase ErfK/SrfK
MTRIPRAAGWTMLAVLAVFAANCKTGPEENANTASTANTSNSQVVAANSPSPAVASASPLAPAPSPSPEEVADSAFAVTLPVLDAFFADETFPAELKSQLQLSDDQIARLRNLARDETSKLSEGEGGKHTGTASASALAIQRIQAVIGPQKTQQLVAMVRDRSNSESAGVAESTASAVPASSGFSGGVSGGTTASSTRNVNLVPADSRIVVNAPSYRMDVFEDGRLIKSYKIGIGYPEFPLPKGLRKASTIIFNPTWTPPDSPWVATMSHVKVGERVEAGSKYNPLGPIKIPIGMPSLIHGGKPAAKLGGFASHGCVGLTNGQVQDFARVLGQVGGTRLTDAEIAQYAKNRSQTREVKLSRPVPVELRYETIIVEGGKLHVYKDVYDKGTNSEENLRNVLQAYGVSVEQLSEHERAAAKDALRQMSRNGGGHAASHTADQSPDQAHDAGVRKGQKEIVIDISALAGKGYPAPVNFSMGAASKKTPAASEKPKSTTQPQ